MKSSVRWYGNSEVGASFFYYEERPEQPDAMEYMRSQFAAVKAQLEFLCEQRDGNGARVAQLVAEPSGPVRQPYIAFRFTSDWARNQYDWELVKLGGSLGRGVWRPFGAGRCGNDLMSQPLLQGE